LAIYREELISIQSQATEAQRVADTAREVELTAQHTVQNHQALTPDQEFSRLHLAEQLEEIKRLNQLKDQT